MHIDSQIALADGTRIGFARYGCDHGRPAFYFHGLPGSRHEARVFHAACAQAGVQLIAPDRPGYGLSDPVSGSPLRAWPRLLTQFADRLGFDRFHVFGVSGGGPYALACAATLGERVCGTAICGGLAETWHAALRAPMAPQARLGFWLAERSAWWLEHGYGALATVAAHWTPRVVVAVMARLNSAPDRVVLRRPDIQALFATNLREAFRQGPAGGVADFTAFVQPWPFDLHSIRNLHLWHGRADGVVPVRHSQYVARRVPGAELVVVDGEGHFSLPVRRAAEIVASLVSC